IPVRVKKTRQNPEPRSDSVGTEKALAPRWFNRESLLAPFLAFARACVVFFLRRLAPHVVSIEPIRRVPGWWSGYTLETPPDAARKTRLKLWDALLGQNVRVKWIDGIKLDLRMGTDIARLVFVAGEIDPNEFSFLAAFLQPGMSTIDIGANEGLYTLFFRKRVGPQGHVIAIEPSARELQQLRKNLRINGFADVEVVASAIGAEPAQAQLSVAEPGHAGFNALGAIAAPWVSFVSQTEVTVTTLDLLAEARNWPRIDLIKMDIEGSELNALRGAQALLARDRPVLLLEAEEESLSLRGSSLTELLDWLAARNYEAMDFSDADGSPVPLGARQPRALNLVFLPKGRPTGR
ncbi:MAG: FkbM family methyltransferase, partial [Bradyrhizobium sp.]|uniref:FkbM family methyltransferase n=1 Tax=Bradyrhizobium sp. TaxID=376 RepID=UPI00238BED34